MIDDIFTVAEISTVADVMDRYLLAANLCVGQHGLVGRPIAYIGRGGDLGDPVAATAADDQH